MNCFQNIRESELEILKEHTDQRFQVVFENLDQLLTVERNRKRK